jgi:hypothetical protein
MRNAFSVNGFGTTITNNCLHQVGEFKCAHCGRITPWAVYKRTKRISLLFIPTAGVDSEYAFMCTRCKEGYVVSAEQAGKAMAGSAEFVMGEKGVTVVDK